MIPANSLPEEVWRSSSYSGPNGGDCIEVADGLPVIPVRDSKVKDGAAIVVSSAAWSMFVSSVK